jgi:hypothetical protein
MGCWIEVTAGASVVMAAILVRLGSGEVGREGGWWVVVSVGGEVSLVMARK